MKKVYELFSTTNKGYIKIFLLLKKERTDKQKVDGIRLQIKSPNVHTKTKIINIDLKDWEVLSIITGLSEALVRKKLVKKGYVGRYI